MEFVICGFCDELFFAREGQIYCSRTCKERAKKNRRNEELYALGIKKRMTEINANRTINPNIRYKNYEKTKLYARDQYFRNTFNITREQAEEMKAKHTNCDICKTTEPRGRDNKWHINHIKGTQIIRGLLCNNCNLGIGFLRHDLEILANAITYLKRFS